MRQNVVTRDRDDCGSRGLQQDIVQSTMDRDKNGIWRMCFCGKGGRIHELVFKVRLRNYQAGDGQERSNETRHSSKSNSQKATFCGHFQGPGLCAVKSEEDLWKGGQECKIPEVVFST